MANEIRRGDVFYIYNDSSEGCEQSGCRPAVIISNDAGNKYSPTVNVMWVTSQAKKDLPTHLELENGFTILGEQISTIDKSKIGNRLRHLSNQDMRKVNRIIMTALGIIE